MTSADNDMARSVVGGAGAGNGAASATNRLDAGSGEAIAGSSATASANNRINPGYVSMFAFPGAVTDLTGLDDVNTSTVSLQWTSPGVDGPRGTFQAGSSYYLRVASYTVPDTFALFSQANVVFSTAGDAPGARVSTGVAGLIANTTYFVALWTKSENNDLSYPTFLSTFTTLALAPGALSFENTFPSVQASSVSVAWGALALAPPDASSKTAEGYLLEISSTNFGLLSPGGVINSSATMSMAASTLTVALPDAAATTNYYRVSSLNWEGRKNTLQIGKMNFQILQSTGLIDLGSLTALERSTVSVSSMVVYNVGDISASFSLSAATATTPSSAWTLSTSSDVETVTLQGVWNTGPPAPSADAFSTFLTTTPRPSGGGGGNYAGDQTGVLVPSGSSRTLWFRFWAPTSTLSTSPETIRVTVDAAKP